MNTVTITAIARDANGTPLAGLLSGWLPERLSFLRIDELSLWIMSVPNTAGQRAILIGVGLAYQITGSLNMVEMSQILEGTRKLLVSVPPVLVHHLVDDPAVLLSLTHQGLNLEAEVAQGADEDRGEDWSVRTQRMTPAEIQAATAAADIVPPRARSARES